MPALGLAITGGKRSVRAHVSLTPPARVGDRVEIWRSVGYRNCASAATFDGAAWQTAQLTHDAPGLTVDGGATDFAFDLSAWRELDVEQAAWLTVAWQSADGTRRVATSDLDAKRRSGLGRVLWSRYPKAGERLR